VTEGAVAVAVEETNSHPTLYDLVSRLTEARDMIDVNIAAGIAIEELTGQQVGTPPTDGLKPI